MLKQLRQKIDRFRNTPLFKNSFWGISSNVLQNIFLTLFFVILARKLSTQNFANYLISNALYQLLAAFSTFGLSQWFIRELDDTKDEKGLINRFFKLQFLFGAAFYLINILIAFALYKDRDVRIFSLLFGLNIIFDNLIYAIKALNIAKHEQKITFRILILESVLLFLVACLLYMHPFSVAFLIMGQNIIRLISLNLFIRIGTHGMISIRSILRYKVSFSDVKYLVLRNWMFVIIGSISLIYWRSANIIVSKFLTLADVAIYGISYKVFSVFIIFPLIVSNTVYPSIVRLYNSGDHRKLETYYKEVFLFYFLYGLLSYSFIYSFSDVLLPFIFSKSYSETAHFTKEMFLTILVFPTAILQANLLVAMKLEKFDMWINIICLVLYMVLTATGFLLIRSLDVIYFSIFISFLLFHVIQDIVLIRKKLLQPGHMVFFYGVSVLCVLGYVGLIRFFNPYGFFIIYWILIGGAYGYYYLRGRKRGAAPIQKGGGV